MKGMEGGIKDMDGLPGAVVVVDILTDDIAVREARKLKIPVVALADTNTDPTLINYPVPCNDDATKTIQLILGYVAQAITDGKAKVKVPAKSDDRTAGNSKTAAPKGREQKEVEEEITAVKGVG